MDAPLDDRAARRGVLTLAPAGDEIGPETGAYVFAQTRSGLAASLHVAAGHSVFTITEARIAGAQFLARIRFEWERLRRIELVMTASPEGVTWPEWTAEGELTRKLAHEAWAELVFGRPMNLLRIFAPEPVAAPGPGYPRSVGLDWGELISWYDGKAGAASLTVVYGTRDPGADGGAGAWGVG